MTKRNARGLSSLLLWKWLGGVASVWAIVATAMLVGWLPAPVALRGKVVSSPAALDQGFQEFESVAFVREFTERYLSFTPANFRSMQLAAAFWLGEDLRARRLGEVNRLEPKIIKQQVEQSATLMTLRRGRDYFEADLKVSLSEAGRNRSEFWTRIRVAVSKVERSIENPWGFLVENIQQSIIQNVPVSDDLIAVRPESAVLLRFPCLIENVEVEKESGLRVKLTTLDISELQIKSEGRASGKPRAVKAACRDRIFSLHVIDDVGANLLFRSLNLADSKPIPVAGPRRKSGVEKTIEEQLGFVTE